MVPHWATKSLTWSFSRCKTVPPSTSSANKQLLCETKQIFNETKTPLPTLGIYPAGPQGWCTGRDHWRHHNQKHRASHPLWRAPVTPVQNVSTRHTAANGSMARPCVIHGKGTGVQCTRRSTHVTKAVFGTGTGHIVGDIWKACMRT